MHSSIIQDDKKTYVFDLKDNQKFNLLIFTDNKKNINLKIKINLAKKNIVNIYGLDLNKEKEKKYSIDIYHNDNHSISNISFLSLAKNQAKTCIYCQSYNKKGKINNKINQNITGFILDDKSSIVSIPSLDINDNNVVANHIVNVGQINPNTFFYLGSKGFTKQEVYSLLINGFKSQIIKDFPKQQKSIIYSIDNFFVG
ncbi:SufD family Fe-S cluster assembly protein [bacterium]|nr:SufD family Fe-S cluster assembly protein [bacterium]